MKLKFTSISVFFILMCAMNLHAQDFRYAPPGETWYTIQSEHFSVTFPKKEKPLAKKLINIAESSYIRMTTRMQWVPERKTYILLTNATDATNGESTPYFYNNIVIFAIPPDAYTSIINYDNWIKMIFVHEYTHTLHLDQSRGFFGFLNDIFGRLLFVNLIEPNWIKEGYAVYNESSLTPAGRDNSSYFNAVLRMQALANTLPPIDEGNGIPSKWPFGEWPYLYGGKFMQYLANNYSPGSLADFSKQYTYIPLFIERASKLAFDDHKLTSLWNDWQASIRKQAILTSLSVMLSGKTGSVEITHIGANTRGPIWDTGGNGIYYTSYDGRSLMGIFYTLITAGHKKWITRRNSGYTSSLCKNRLFFPQMDFFKNFYLYNDIYELNIKTDKLKRLTYGLRARGVDVSSDCKKVVFVSNTATTSSLMIYYLTDPGFMTVIAGIDETGQFLNPRWSWNKKNIAVTIKNNNGGSGIEIINEKGEKLTTVVSDDYLNLFPSWSRDDRYVLFSSDRTGIANLYAYSITEKTIYRITNVVGGAYESQVSPNNKTIAFTKYDTSGFNIYTMPFTPSSFGKVSSPQEFTVKQVQSYKSVKTTEKKYSPFATLKPTWWIPNISLTSDAYSFGIYTSGSDLLRHNKYSVLLAYTEYPRKKKRAGFRADYSNTSGRFEISVHGAIMPYIASTYTEPASNKSRAYLQQKNEFSTTLSYPINHVRYRQKLGIGYHYTFIKSLTVLPPYINNQPFTGILSGFTLNYSIDTTSVFNTSISREDGIYFNTGVERDLSILGSDRNLFQSFSEFRAYIPGFAENHVIYFKGSYGFISGKSKNNDMFSIGGVQSAFNDFNRTNIPVRGYSAGKLTGTQTYAASLEYRYPIGIVDRGIGTLPFYLGKISLTAFADAGSNTLKTIVSTGIEINFDTYLAYIFPFRFKFGYAYLYNSYPPSSFYFLIGKTI